MNHIVALVFSGLVWLVMGVFLLYKGLFLTTMFAPHQEALLLICGGLFVGFLKGRFVLSKTVARTVKRIGGLSVPIKWNQLYSKGYFILILSMMLLGMALRFSPLPPAYRGGIDVAIGSALINGALLFFKCARSFRRESL